MTTPVGGAGAVYVYKRTGSSWVQEAYVKATLNDPGDQFGYSVALDNATLVVGAIYEGSQQTTINNGSTASYDNTYKQSGAVYVYLVQ